MQKIYVDSSYDWNKTKEGKGVGKMCIFDGNNYEVIEKELNFPGLKQLNNRFELEAIEYARNKFGADCIIFSDSKVAVGWANKMGILNAIWCPREENKAGIYLDGI